jgi:superfamily II DNA or RNA helicase
MDDAEFGNQVASQIEDTEARLAALDRERVTLMARLENLRRGHDAETSAGRISNGFISSTTTNESSLADKLALFRRLFQGRQDVYARRWESAKTGRSGYQPACSNEWEPGVCAKPKAKCAECPHRELLPLTDEVILNHLRGADPAEAAVRGASRDFTVGVYPLLPDETCWFLAADFDKTTWEADALAFMETCQGLGIPAGLERSRSGRGGHVWTFFAEPIPATLARKLGSFLLTRTMERRPELGLDSYDRFFPNQDTMPQGGFGNLIALPLQRKPRGLGNNSLFVDDNLVPYVDQVAFLSSLRPMPAREVAAIVEDAQRAGQILGVRMAVAEGDEDEPWSAPPSRHIPESALVGPFTKRVDVVIGNQVYIEREGLPPSLINRLIRVAAFQNPEFYKAQAMRLSTFGKPRIISCAEDYPRHLALPRGCLEEVVGLLSSVGTQANVHDERVSGQAIEVSFQGSLRPDQQAAFESLAAHDFGVLAATTAFGKTVVAARLIAARGVNALVLVHRQQLLDQWVERLSQFLGLDPSAIGQIGAGKRKPKGCIDVALIQSLCHKGVVDDVVGEYGHLIVDECHHLPAVSFELVARAAKARYVTGLSATAIRKDGHHPIVFMQCGPVRYRVDARAQAGLQPFDHRVVVRRTAFRVFEPQGPEAAPTIQQLYALLTADEDRNAMIVTDVLDALAQGRSPVVLTERRDHLELLVSQLESSVRNLVVLKGGMGTKRRRAVAEQLASIPEDEERVLMATGRYLGEGFDDARLDTLFLTMPISWKGTLAQYAGRLHRLHDRKTEVLIYDYADLEVPMLARMHARRLKGYQAIGYRSQCAEPSAQRTSLPSVECEVRQSPWRGGGA